jgi:phosphoribosylaminoimidazole-succinocarboxamide synthase
MPPAAAVFAEGLAHTLDRTDLSGLGKKYEGKVRDCYLPGDGKRILITTDRISAFDRVLGTLPYKGQILNRVAAFWFEATKDLAPSHLLAVPDPNVTVGIDCTPLPVELVMRGYLTGVTSTSIWTHYAAGKRMFAGHALPDGMKKNEPLPAPILTPSTKAPFSVDAKAAHDVTVSKEELLAMGELSEADFEVAATMAHRLFARGQTLAASRGLILVDTKYEMGKTPDGRIVVIDEIHTPDSSRYWKADSYEARMSAGGEPDSFDKEYVRRWLADVGFKGDGPIPTIPDEVRIEASRRYAEAAEAICGEPFVPDTREPMARLEASLAPYRT